MRRNMIRAVLASLVAAGAVAALPGIASAGVEIPDPIGGRERVKVTVISTEPLPLNCAVSVKGAPPVTLPVAIGGRQSVVIPQVAPGPGTVHVVCPGTTVDRTLPVDVDLANPALDAIDSVFVSTGSSALATDPTLR